MACSDQLPRGVGFCTGRWWLSCEMATASFEEQRTNIRFCVLLGHTPTQTHSMLQTAYGTSAVAVETVRKWHRRYREGRQTATADPRSGRPSTSRTADHVEEVGRIIREDRRQSVQDVAVKVGISYGSCYAILTTDLHMRRVCAKWVPKLLSPDPPRRHPPETTGEVGERAVVFAARQRTGAHSLQRGTILGQHVHCCA